MRKQLILLLILLGSTSIGSALADPPPTDVTGTGPHITVQPYPWADLGTNYYGKNYEVYIPREIKSNSPEVVRNWDPSGYPRNGNQLTPLGMACTNDADCAAPLGCFKRADSGQIAVKLCAFPPTY